MTNAIDFIKRYKYSNLQIGYALSIEIFNEKTDIVCNNFQTSSFTNCSIKYQKKISNQYFDSSNILTNERLKPTNN